MARALYSKSVAAGALCVLTMCSAAIPASAASAPVTSSASPLRLTALKFSQSAVDASTGTAKVKLTWAITDSARKATDISGTVLLGVPGPKPGTFRSASFTIGFRLHGKAPVTGSGTARKSSYQYTFQVPRYARVSPAGWQICQLTVRDNVGSKLGLTLAGLKSFGAVLTATELLDTTPPAYQDLTGQVRPYVYTGQQPGEATYQFEVLDSRAGFGQGTIEVSGPGGRHITTNFANRPDQFSGGFECGDSENNSTHDTQCAIPVTFPVGTPAGIWVVSSLRLTDFAGNTATFTKLDAAPITVTSDHLVKASQFKLTPDPVNDWSMLHPSYPVHLSMRVTGAVRGVTRVFVDLSSSCSQTATVPKIGGTKVTVPLSVPQGTAICQVTGIAVVDGTGHVALYGSEYGAPDPFLLIKQVPDTKPPTATSVAISPTTLPSSQTSGTELQIFVSVDTPAAPVTSMTMNLYDSAGTIVASGPGPISDEYQGEVIGLIGLPSLPAGSYAIGFTITDAGSLSTSYGPGAKPMPGGPLSLVVTPG